MTEASKLQRDRTRRETLGILGGAGVAVFVEGCGGNAGPVSSAGVADAGGTSDASGTADGAATGADGAVTPACVVRPTQTAGPYFVDEMLQRSDIRTDPTDGTTQGGAVLELTFRVSRIAGASCAPLAGVMVDVWQCNAAGVYSDVVDTSGLFNTKGKKFLRGYLLTDDRGVATFTTIYPGWYTGRTPHIHFKIRTAPDSGTAHQFTSQLYFDDALTDQVFLQAPYSAKGMRNTTNATDSIYQQGGDQLLLSLTPTAQGYAAEFKLGLQF